MTTQQIPGGPPQITAQITTSGIVPALAPSNATTQKEDALVFETNPGIDFRTVPFTPEDLATIAALVAASQNTPSTGGGVVVKTFLATTANAFAAMQAAQQIPSTGVIAARIEGFGGGGGAPGNQGGSPTSGGGGGGAQYQSAVITLDLTHSFDVTIGAGGAGSAGTPNGSGVAPNDGGAGTPTELTDATAASVVWSAIGANGGTAIGSATGFSGQAGGPYARADIGLTQPAPNVTTSGSILPMHYLPGTGGRGGQNAGVNGGNGAPAMTGLGLFAGGVGGVNGGPGTNTDGHGGGGGAAGPRGNGGAGGFGTANGSNLPGGDGASAGANTGAGGGAGGGGPNGGTQNGSNGGSGGSGWMRVTFFLNTTVVP